MTLLTEETALELIRELRALRALMVSKRPSTQDTSPTTPTTEASLREEIIAHVNTYWSSFHEPIDFSSLNRSFGAKSRSIGFKLLLLCSDPSITLLTAKSGKRSFCPTLHLNEALSLGSYTGLDAAQNAEMIEMERKMLAEFNEEKN